MMTFRWNYMLSFQTNQFSYMQVWQENKRYNIQAKMLEQSTIQGTNTNCVEEHTSYVSCSNCLTTDRYLQTMAGILLNIESVRPNLPV